MMTPSDSNASGRKELQRKLIELREEHRDLDQAIAAMNEPGAADSANQVRVQRLKKRKLALKDQIAQIESALLPDIIA
jgi:hypothetical protein